MKKIISTILVAAMMCSFSVQALAYSEKSSGLSDYANEVTVRDYTLSDMAAAFQADPTVSNVRLLGNTLTYNMPDGTAARVTETVLAGGVRIFYCEEGNRTATVTLDVSNNRLYYDNKPVEFSAKETYDQRMPVAGNGAKTEWIYMGTVDYNATCEVMVRTMVSSALWLVITSACPAVGLTLGGCQAIINLADVYNLLTKTVYIRRYDYHDPSYYGYKFIYYYYCDSSYTLLAGDATHTDIIWT